jgi:hypothetical protein
MPDGGKLGEVHSTRKEVRHLAVSGYDVLCTLVVVVVNDPLEYWESLLVDFRDIFDACFVGVLHHGPPCCVGGTGDLKPNPTFYEDFGPQCKHGSIKLGQTIAKPPIPAFALLIVRRKVPTHGDAE